MLARMNAPHPFPRPQVHRFEFGGSGGEYFRIWIVNVALTILTLGVYSAWAKVRTLQYFYRNTSLAGASFDYHGLPLAILKGRAIAVAMLVALNFAERVHWAAWLAALAAVAAAMPWLLKRSFRFRLVNTSYRGLRFGFDGATSAAYRALLAWPLAALASLGLLWPKAHREVKRYQIGEARFGAERFHFSATAREFYHVYIRISLVALLPLALLATGVFVAFADGEATTSRHGSIVAIGAGFAALVVALVLIRPLARAWLHNLFWNRTRLGVHRFRSTATGRRLAWIVVTNTLLTVITLGLYQPFARVRLARYLLASMSFACIGGMDALVAGGRARIDAAGEEIADALDLDVAL